MANMNLNDTFYVNWRCSFAGDVIFPLLLYVLKNMYCDVWSYKDANSECWDKSRHKHHLLVGAYKSYKRTKYSGRTHSQGYRKAIIT